MISHSLVSGTKIDLRTDPGEQNKLQADGKSAISKKQGIKLSKKIGAVKYMECSALTQDGLKDVFSEAVRAVIAPIPSKTKRSCTIL